MAGRYVAPEYRVSPYTCPHCSTLAPQEHGQAAVRQPTLNGAAARYADDTMYLSYCTSCSKKVVWVRIPDYKKILEALREPSATGPVAATVPLTEGTDDDEDVEEPTILVMRYPAKSAAPPPNEDLPDDIKKDYREAASVLALSSRSAAALLRLCLQKLCVHFGQPGKDINRDIGALVADGTIRPMVQKAMDTVRISGNESVHPGELNIEDDEELALALFTFINLIADEAITQPKNVEAIYNKMPEPKRNGIAQRDGTPPSGSPTPLN